MKTYLLVNGNVRTVKEGVNPTTAIANLEAKGLTVQKIKSPPSIKTMEKWVCDGIARATDGCKIEPDGVCQHGHKSWLLVLGYM